MRNFLKADDYIRKSTQDRISIDPSNLLTWGVDYLDFHFGGGIAPRSFNLLACESGRGKTTMVSNMAIQNGLKGKRVAFIRLEGDLNDFADTEKWKILYPYIVEMVKSGQLEKFPDYQAFRMNSIKGISDLELAAEQILKDRMKNIFLFDKTQSVNSESIYEVLKSLKDEADLVIIDHLHYMDIVDDKRRWIEQMETVKIINEFVDKVHIPVTLVCHINKKDSKYAKGLLRMDDIQGSSDIFKIAHNVLFMSPYYEEYNMDEMLFPTLFYSPKARYGAPTTRIGIKTFDGRSKEYKKGYEIAEQKMIKGEWTIERKTSRAKSPASNNF